MAERKNRRNNSRRHKWIRAMLLAMLIGEALPALSRILPQQWSHRIGEFAANTAGKAPVILDQLLWPHYQTYAPVVMLALFVTYWLSEDNWQPLQSILYRGGMIMINAIRELWRQADAEAETRGEKKRHAQWMAWLERNQAKIAAGEEPEPPPPPTVQGKGEKAE